MVGLRFKLELRRCVRVMLARPALSSEDAAAVAEGACHATSMAGGKVMLSRSWAAAPALSNEAVAAAAAAAALALLARTRASAALAASRVLGRSVDTVCNRCCRKCSCEDIATGATSVPASTVAF